MKMTDTYITDNTLPESNSGDNDSALQWQVGVMYYKNKVENDNHVQEANLTTLEVTRTAFHSNTRQTTDQLGAFAEGTYRFSDATRLTAGVRYDHTKVDVDQTYLNVFNNGLVIGNPGADQVGHRPGDRAPQPRGGRLRRSGDARLLSAYRGA